MPQLCVLVEGHASDAVAWGSFTDRIMQTGASVLDVHTAPSASGSTQAFAAGFLEGALTSELIFRHFNNQWTLNFPANTSAPVAPPREAAFVEQHVAWMYRQVAAPPSAKEAAYWQHVGFLLEQLDGMAAG